ncbi:MAG TPA: hypothetical protein PLG02_06020 [Methylotenera sp.]|nr:hypothetical protein [Methylotenera sp.]
MSSVSLVNASQISSFQSTSKANSPQTFKATLDATFADKTSISQAAHNRAAEEKRSGGTYDFTNMTPQQLQQTMNDLIKSGKLSLDESGPLIVMIPTALSKVQYDGAPPTAYYQPTNILANLELGIEGAKSRNDNANVESLTKALDALKRIQSTKLSG